MNNQSVSPLRLFLLMAGVLLVVSCSPQAGKPQGNRPPVITQIVGQSYWLPSTAGSLTCIASDPDGDNLTYTWTADNGTISGEGPTITWMPPAAMGKYNITLVVSDGRGGEATQVNQESVIINADGTISQDAPVVLNVTLPSENATVVARRLRIWTALKVEVTVQDKQDNSFRYKWSASAGRFQAKGLDEGTASSVTWIAPGAGGDYTVNVSVTDHPGNVGEGTVNFKVFCCGN